MPIDRIVLNNAKEGVECHYRLRDQRERIVKFKRAI